MASKDAVLRKMGRAVSGRLRLPAVTRLVRYVAAKEYEDGNLAEAKRLYEKIPESARDTAIRLRLGVILRARVLRWRKSRLPAGR